MTDKEPCTLEICVDCLMLLANGEVSDGEGNDLTDAHAARMQAVWRDTEITLGHLSEPNDDGEYDEPEPWFSWSQCDGCRSNLGGDREYATAWVIPSEVAR